jgi:hypothetical protein
VLTSSSWYVEHADGTFTLTVLRRLPDSEGRWLRAEFDGKTLAAARAAYSRFVGASAERTRRLHARMQRWGPT